MTVLMIKNIRSYLISCSKVPVMQWKCQQNVIYKTSLKGLPDDGVYYYVILILIYVLKYLDETC